MTGNNILATVSQVPNKTQKKENGFKKSEGVKACFFEHIHRYNPFYDAPTLIHPWLLRC